MASHRFQNEYSGHRTDWNTMQEWEVWGMKNKNIIMKIFFSQYLFKVAIQSLWTEITIRLIIIIIIIITSDDVQKRKLHVSNYFVPKHFPTRASLPIVWHKPQLGSRPGSPATGGSRWGAPLQRCGWAGQDWESCCCTSTRWAVSLRRHCKHNKWDGDLKSLQHNPSLAALQPTPPQGYLALMRPCSTPQAISLTALVISYLDV